MMGVIAATDHELFAVVGAYETTPMDMLRGTI